MNRTRKASRQPTTAKMRKASKYASADACCSRRFSSDCQAICAAATGVAVRLHERNLRLREIGVYRRVERVEPFVEPQGMKILPPLLDRLADRHAHAAALIAQEGE